ncbi:hypothetical protein ACMFMG_010466 [Clarireedia jacksonii]
MIALNKNPFFGSTSSIKSLSLLTTDGHVLNFTSTPDDSVIRNYIEQATFAWLIPEAWSLSSEGFYPVILDSGEGRGDANALREHVSDDTVDETKFCYEGHLYYFISASGNYHECMLNRGGIICGNKYFTALPGMGEVKFGGDYESGLGARRTGRI